MFLSLFLYHMPHAQIEKFDIEYPWSQDVERLKADSLGHFWMHNNKDFFYYNGHQVTALGLGDILGKKQFDYSFTGDIIFIDKNLLFINEKHLSLVDPESKEITNHWSLPESLDFNHLYEDDLGRIWVFAKSKTGSERPVFISTEAKTDFRAAFDLSQHIGDRGVFWDFEIDDKDGLLFIQWRLGDVIIINDKGEEVTLDISNQEDLNYKKNCSQFRLDNNNKLWRIRDKMFDIYDASTKSFTKHPLTDRLEFSNYCNLSEGRSLLNLRSIYQDSKNRIWMTFSASYLVMYDPETDDNTAFRSLLVKELEGGAHDTRSIIEDKDGNIWGNKKGGLFKIREKVNYFESYAVNTSDANHPIYKGKDQKTIKALRGFYGDFSIRNISIHDIAEDQEGDLIIQDGTYTFKIDRKSNSVEVLPIIAPKEKVHFHKDKEDSFYATWDAYYALDENFTGRKIASAVNKIENTLRRKNGDLWISGLLSQHEFMFGKLKSSTLEFEGNIKDPNGNIDFISTYVSSIVEDSQGRLWVGSDEGILYFDPDDLREIRNIGTFISYDENTINIGKQIDDIAFVDNNLLWFKSKYELGLINTTTLQLERYLPTEELPYSTATTMLPQGDSALWLGNNEGLVYHNFNTNNTFTISYQEGLDTKGAVNVLSKLSSGEIAIGTNNGLYICNPEQLIADYKQKEDIDKKASLSLTGYAYQEGSSNEQKRKYFYNSSKPSIDLAYNDRTLQLSYALSNYNFPSRHRFTHMLEGYETEWSTPSNLNTTTYTNLPPGTYTFKVKGDIGRGVWTEQDLSIPIDVHQAWFRSWWFIIGLILLLSSLIYKWTSYYFSIELEKRKSQEALRNKISGNLHDDVGTILTGIAMQSELLENFANDATKPVAQNIAVRSREAMSRMRDTVWAIDSRKDTIGDLKDRMIDFLDDIMSTKEIRHHMTQSYFDLKATVNPDIRQAAYLNFKESITNVIKHSDTNELWIDINVTKDQINYVIKDKGHEKENIKTSGTGLRSMAERAEKLGGTFNFSYKDGYITKVSLPL